MRDLEEAATVLIEDEDQTGVAKVGTLLDESATIKGSGSKGEVGTGKGSGSKSDVRPRLLKKQRLSDVE